MYDRNIPPPQESAQSGKLAPEETIRSATELSVSFSNEDNQEETVEETLARFKALEAKAIHKVPKGSRISDFLRYAASKTLGNWLEKNSDEPDFEKLGRDASTNLIDYDSQSSQTYKSGLTERLKAGWEVAKQTMSAVEDAFTLYTAHDNITTLPDWVQGSAAKFASKITMFAAVQLRPEKIIELTRDWWDAYFVLKDKMINSRFGNFPIFIQEKNSRDEQANWQGIRGTVIREHGNSALNNEQAQHDRAASYIYRFSQEFLNGKEYRLRKIVDGEEQIYSAERFKSRSETDGGTTFNTLVTRQLGDKLVLRKISFDPLNPPSPDELSQLIDKAFTNVSENDGYTVDQIAALQQKWLVRKDQYSGKSNRDASDGNQWQDQFDGIDLILNIDSAKNNSPSVFTQKRSDFASLNKWGGETFGVPMNVTLSSNGEVVVTNNHQSINGNPATKLLQSVSNRFNKPILNPENSSYQGDSQEFKLTIPSIGKEHQSIKDFDLEMYTHGEINADQHGYLYNAVGEIKSMYQSHAERNWKVKGKWSMGALLTITEAMMAEGPIGSALYCKEISKDKHPPSEHPSLGFAMAVMPKEVREAFNKIYSNQKEVFNDTSLTEEQRLDKLQQIVSENMDSSLVVQMDAALKAFFKTNEAADQKNSIFSRLSVATGLTLGQNLAKKINDILTSNIPLADKKTSQVGTLIGSGGGMVSPLIGRIDAPPQDQDDLLQMIRFGTCNSQETDITWAEIESGMVKFGAMGFVQVGNEIMYELRTTLSQAISVAYHDWNQPTATDADKFKRAALKGLFEKLQVDQLNKLELNSKEKKLLNEVQENFKRHALERMGENGQEYAFKLAVVTDILKYVAIQMQESEADTEPHGVEAIDEDEPTKPKGLLGGIMRRVRRN